MKKLILPLLLLTTSSAALAGGWLTNTNQNIAFLRNPARDGAIGIDGVYSNPAGVIFLPQGLHISLNIQSAYQNREVTSTFAPFAYGTANNGQAEKLFKGDAQAPVVPSIQIAYNHNRWSYSFNFAIGGGGGKCAFKHGLGSFESQASLLPLLGADLGITQYSLDSYMRGRQYYYGFQIGAAYKITDNLSAFVGGRLIYATANYYGYMRNICVNNPTGEGMVNASELFSSLATSYSQLSGQYSEAGYTEAATTYAQAATQMATLAAATEDVSLNCDQTGWGFTPILSLDWKIGKFNFAVKYEFKTKIRLDNRSANSASAERLESLQSFMDGVTIKQDIPALLTLGTQYQPIPTLRLMAGFHYYFDKQASQENDTQKYLKSGSREILAGIEYDINKRLQISGGWQNTHFGTSDEYIKDISFNVNSNSVGLGLGIQATKHVKVNIAYFHSFYRDYKRTESDYNNISNTLLMALDEETVAAYVASGALSGTDSFTRKNKVFGLGVDLSF